MWNYTKGLKTENYYWKKGMCQEQQLCIFNIKLKYWKRNIWLVYRQTHLKVIQLCILLHEKIKAEE